MGFINSIHDTKTGCDSVIAGAMDVIICYDSANTVNKVAIGPLGFSLDENKVYKIKFINGNTADNPTLNINGTGAKSIDSDGFNIADGIIYNLSYENNKYRVYISKNIGYRGGISSDKHYLCFKCQVDFTESIHVEHYVLTGWYDNGKVCYANVGKTWWIKPYLNIINGDLWDQFYSFYYGFVFEKTGTWEFPLQVISLCSRDSAINKICLTKNTTSSTSLCIYLKDSSSSVYCLTSTNATPLNVSNMMICLTDACALLD